MYDAEVRPHEADDNEDQHRAEHLARGEDVALGHVVVPVARVRTVQDRACPSDRVKSRSGQGEDRGHKQAVQNC